MLSASLSRGLVSIARPAYSLYASGYSIYLMSRRVIRTSLLEVYPTRNARSKMLRRERASQGSGRIDLLSVTPYYIQEFGLWQMRRNQSVKSRLGEITRRSVVLSATSSKLASMALQLDQLRKLSARAELLSNHDWISDYKYDRYPIFSAAANDRDAT